MKGEDKPSELPVLLSSLKNPDEDFVLLASAPVFRLRRWLFPQFFRETIETEAAEESAELLQKTFDQYLTSLVDKIGVDSDSRLSLDGRILKALNVADGLADGFKSDFLKKSTLFDLSRFDPALLKESLEKEKFSALNHDRDFNAKSRYEGLIRYYDQYRKNKFLGGKGKESEEIQALRNFLDQEPDQSFDNLPTLLSFFLNSPRPLNFKYLSWEVYGRLLLDVFLGIEFNADFKTLRFKNAETNQNPDFMEQKQIVEALDKILRQWRQGGLLTSLKLKDLRWKFFGKNLEDSWHEVRSLSNTTPLLFSSSSHLAQRVTANAPENLIP